MQNSSGVTFAYFLYSTINIAHAVLEISLLILSSLSKLVKTLPLLVLMAIAGAAHAYEQQVLPAVTLQQAIEKYSIGSQVATLEDVEAKWSIEDVSSAAFAPHFIATSSQIPNFGYSNSVYWVRIQLDSSLEQASKWLLELAFPHIDHISLFIPSENGFTKSVTGDALPFAQRELRHQNFIFHLELDAKQSQVMYMRLQTQSPVQLPINLYTPDKFAEDNNFELLLSGLFYGTLIVVAFYNLFLYFSIRESFYLHYVLYVSFLALGQFTFYGLSFAYLWPESTWFQSVSAGLVGGAAFLFAGLFAINFLRAKSYAPLFYKMGIYCMLPACIAVMTMSLFLPLKYAVFILMFVAMVGCPSLLVTGWLCWRRGYSPARYFLMAWMALLVVCVVWCFSSLGFLPTSPLFNYSIQIGSSLEVILLSFALADRINYEKRQKYTAKKEALEAKTQAVANLEKADKLKDQFMATISHELRTPMNGIIGSLELMADEMERQPKEIATPLKAMESSARHMLSLVDDVICFSEIRSGNFSIVHEDFHLKESIGPTIEYFQMLCQAKGLKFTVHWDNSLSEVYVGDIKRVNKVLLHLLDNALKFTEQGEIQLLIEKSSNRVPTDQYDAIRFSVVDTGMGIDAEKHKQVYSAFQQGDNSITRDHGGLGIGLAICHALVQAMEGTISFATATRPSENESTDNTVESIHGDRSKSEVIKQGTRFDVVLFLKRRAGETAAKVRSLHPRTQPLNILVVEDNQVNQMVLCNLVAKLGHHHLTANHGGEAVALFDSEPVDLIFMDCQMPVMDGLQATQIIRQRNKDVPIIAVTANAIENYRQNCLDAGMNDFVAKPVRKKVIADMIERWGRSQKVSKANKA